jgi:hypothetical protein
MLIQVYGYHGTSRGAANSILRGGFTPSSSGHDWLGPGIYFWQDAPGRAWEWAQKYDDPVVIQSQIVFEQEEAMDLLDRRWFNMLREYHSTFVDQWPVQEIPLPTQNPTTSKQHKLDDAYLEYIGSFLEHNKICKVSLIRAAFTEGSPIYGYSALYDLSHVQISVRDPKCIRYSTIFRVG